MERADLERAGVPSGTPAPGAAPVPIDPDQVAWRAFAEAATPETFHRAWLAIQCRQIHGALSGVVLLGAPDSDRYAPVAFWPEGRRNVRHLGEVAERALKERRGLVIPRSIRRPGEAAARTRYDVAFPIERQGKLHGVVALDVAPRHERDIAAVLRQIQWGASWLESYFLRAEVARLTSVRDRLQTALELAASAFTHQGLYQSATAFVTAVATRLECDRVSLGFVRRGRARVRAMSHTAQFRKETNLSRAIANAMDEAIDQAAVVVYPTPAQAPPQVNRMHGELARQHGAPATCSVPLTEGGEVVGALTFERPQPFDAETVELIEAVAGLAGPILELARRDDRALPAKAADSARRALAAVIGPRHVGLKLGLAAAAAVIVFLATANGDFRVAGTTTLEPLVRRAVVAPFSSYVAEASARAGDLVKSGQLLARLDDRELRLERLKLAGHLEQLGRQYNQALAMRNASQVVILTAQIDQARPQIALLDDQLRRTRLEAPFDGLVTAGDLSQSQAAPVERGQVLYEVSPLDAFRVAVQVDERDIASIAVGQRGSLVLAGAPATALEFTVEKITPVSTVKEARNYFRVEGRLGESTGGLRPGMEGVGKIEIGRRRLVFIWTREIIDWLRLRLWTWLP